MTIRSFPVLHSDELLFSGVARYFDHMDFPNRSASTRELFGARTYKPILDFPSHLDSFTSQLLRNCGYPTTDQIIDEHTLFPLFAPFLPPDRLERLRKAMHEDAGREARLRAGIMSSRIPLIRELRLCTKCVRADRQEFGEAYWHRSHQIQEMKVCHTHEIPLQKMKNDFVGEEYISAEQALKISEWDESKPNKNDIEKFSNLAIDAHWLLDNPQNQITPRMLYKRYFELLDRGGFVQKYSSKLSLNKLSEKFQEYYSNSYLESLHCDLKNHVPSNWLVRLMESSGNDVQHPLHHLLVIRFLGESAETFFQKIYRKKLKGSEEFHSSSYVSTIQLNKKNLFTYPDGKSDQCPAKQAANRNQHWIQQTDGLKTTVKNQ